DVATIALLHERSLRQRELLAEQFQIALNQRVLVEQAKGALAERHQESVAEAFARMRILSRQNGRPLGEVARAVVDDVPLHPA
ncbi:MAG: ANTAR domain-containing protein, partial [Nocardioides sp.]|nr:ANTAR domain-containing protein [Nocardioides sp.]